MKKINIIILCVLIALPIVVVGILYKINPNNENILEIASILGAIWEGIALLFFYNKRKQNKSE